MFLYVNFLQDRGHVTRYAGLLSGIEYINASVVQGSGFGPTGYVVSASDLRTVDPENRISKYADDTYLIIGSSKRHTVRRELENVAVWASRNNLGLNPKKSREMIIARKGNADPPKTDMGRVSSKMILGVLVSNDIHATNHIESLSSSCSRSLYALRVLRSHGLRAEALHVITGATTVARLLYASPAWLGLTSAKDRDRLEQFLRRIQRMGFLHAETPTIAEMVGTAEYRLLRSIIANTHHLLRAKCHRLSLGNTTYKA